MALRDSLSKIENLFAEWQALKPLSRENNDRLWQKFRLEWNYNSNHIEGNTLTYGETKLLLIFDKTTGNHELREYEEMKAHDVAIHAVHSWAEGSERDLTEADIRQLNRIILVKPYWKEAITEEGQPTRRQIKVGEYKEFPNSVRLPNGEMFRYEAPENVPVKMQELMDWYRANQNEHPILLAAEMHYRFIRIHPFDDGNGRVARLLVNYILMKNGYAPLIIKSADKANYITALQMADSGNLEAFVDYMAQQLIWSLELSIKAGKGESVEEEDDIDKRISILKKSLAEDDTIRKSKATTDLYEIIRETLFPLFEKIERKCKQLDDLFVQNKLSLIYRENGPTGFYLLNHVSYEDPAETWSTAREKLRNIEYRGIEVKLSGVQFQYEFHGFKKQVEAPNFSQKIEVAFNEYNYQVSINALKILKTYSATLTNEESRRLVDAFVDHFIQKIEQAAKS